MKRLEICPTNHEIVVETDDIICDPGEAALANVSVKLCSETPIATGAIDEKEARMIGNWFLGLAGELSVITRRNKKIKKAAK